MKESYKTWDIDSLREELRLVKARRKEAWDFVVSAKRTLKREETIVAELDRMVNMIAAELKKRTTKRVSK